MGEITASFCVVETCVHNDYWWPRNHASWCCHGNLCVIRLHVVEKMLTEEILLFVKQTSFAAKKKHFMKLGKDILWWLKKLSVVHSLECLGYTHIGLNHEYCWAQQKTTTTHRCITINAFSKLFRVTQATIILIFKIKEVIFASWLQVHQYHNS